MPNKFNKGEWAELYTFLRVLYEGKIHIADAGLNKDDNHYYTVLSVIKNDDSSSKEYLRDVQANSISLFEKNIKISEVPLNLLTAPAKVVLDSIIKNSGTFEIPEIDNLLNLLKLAKIKASSTSKRDITLKLHDGITGTTPQIAFSIKSYIGGNPTLLNASMATRVIYELSKPLSNSDVNYVNNLDSRTKIKDRIQYICNTGSNIVFSNVPNEVFNRNLQMIDSNMPEIFGNLFLLSYQVTGKSVVDVVDLYCRLYNRDKGIIVHKVKDFLVAIALGMEPNTEWLGTEEANGGYIIVKEDGEILCYPIADRDELRNYLYSNAKFDSPSSSRTNSGVVFFDDSAIQCFSLTIQIRF